MRDPNRIEPFLAEVAKMWHKVLDWRFGQLICNMPFKTDPFFLEENEFLDVMKQLLASEEEDTIHN